VTAVTARDGVRLVVHERGAGAPVLCVPGGPGRAAAYLEDLGGLDRTRQLLLLDNRGTGESELPADRASLAFPNLADDLDDVRAALRLDRLDLLGHSAGCVVVLRYAVQHPDRVRRLVLVTPSGRAFGWAADDVPAIRAARSSEPWYADAAEAAAAYDAAPPGLRSELERMTRPFWYGRWDERTQEHAAGADRQMSLRANAGFLPPGTSDPDAARDAVARLAVPTLVVVGERDGLTGAAVAQQLADVMPHAEVARLPTAGHFPWVDAPEEFRAAVERFLAA
jgi:pimeloyl-ACP methyl ester carboxylesterase